MTKTYQLTKQAEADLEDIFIYTAGKWDTAQAEKYLGELGQFMNKLANSKVTGKSCSPLLHGRHDKSETLKYYHANKHYIIYQETPKGIDVITLYHDRMDLEARLKALSDKQS